MLALGERRHKARERRRRLIYSQRGGGGTIANNLWTGGGQRFRPAETKLQAGGNNAFTGRGEGLAEKVSKLGRNSGVKALFLNAKRGEHERDVGRAGCELSLRRMRPGRLDTTGGSDAT